MSSSMLSLLAGLGNGYLKGTRQSLEDERQAKLDNQNTQLFDARMADINRVNTDRQALSDAAKPATANENAVTLNTGDGPRVYEMPKGVDATDVAASDARQFTRSLNQAPAPAPATAEPASMVQTVQRPEIGQTFAVNSVAYPDKVSMQKAQTEHDAPDARNDRIAAAYAATGRPMEATQMQTAVRQGKAADVQWKAAQAQEARDVFNATAMDTFRRLGTFPGAVKLMTDTDALGLAGVKFEAEPSANGKTMRFYRTEPDGKRSFVDSVDNDRKGELDLIRSMLKVSPEKMVEWHVDAQKRAIDAERWEKNFKQLQDQFNTTKGLQQQQIGISGGHLKLAQSDDLRKQTLFDNEAKVPEVVKKSYASLDTAAKAMDAAIYKAQADGLFRPEDPGAQRLMADRAAVSLKMANLLRPYMPDSTPGAVPDPLGFNKAGVAVPAVPVSAAKPVAPVAAPAASMQSTLSAQPPAKAPAADPWAGRSFAQRQADLVSRAQGAARDPELVSLEQRRVAAVQAGKAAQANALIDEFKQIRAKRYGF